ncbi:hypothetical protein [Pseudoduganella sp.]|uniref:hypothetical protein n=1 Tax=Pseudoduganella sp. TaxID=1880898 RepID=UPI0035B4E194
MKKLTCAALLLAAAASQAAPLPDNAELIAINRADQADRTGDIDWTVVNQRDKERREKVGALLAAGAVRSARDFYNAALVFQHGDTPDDYALAFSLATIARQLAPEHPAPKWLHAAAFDRYLVSRNMPQWYGTQSKTYSDGRTELAPVDPKAVSDEQRVALGVPRLQDELARIAEQNKHLQAK